MQQQEPARRPAASASAESEVILRELERRLTILEKADEPSFGSFTAVDWILCVIFFVILPLVLAWWGAG